MRFLGVEVRWLDTKAGQRSGDREKIAQIASESRQSSNLILGTKVSGAPDKQRLANPRDLAGSAADRKSIETTDDWTSGMGFWNAYSQRKRTTQLGLASTFDLTDFANLDFDYLAELLTDLSPEISKAVWDFLLLCNSGYECHAYKPGTEDVDEAAQVELDAIMDKLKTLNGTTGVLFDRLFKMLFLRGSILLELVLEPDGYEFANIATPDTKTLTFKRDMDPILGQVWDFGQTQRGQFVSLKIPTVAYIPVHPNPDSIEGHSLCSAAFFAAIFLMSVLRDTKRVVQHQGYMRLDVEVQFEKLKDTIPEENQSNPEKMLAWMNEVIDQVKTVYASLAPDDTYIHSDSVKINQPVGTVSADSLQGIDHLFQALERMLVRALKTMPLLMATNASRSETQANREWEIYAKGIETIQHFVEAGFEHVAGLAMQAKGFAVDVKLRFAQFRAAEKMRDAQVDMLLTKTARTNFDNGYWSQDEAAHYATGKDAADVPEPRAAAMSDVLSGAPDNPNPGESRFSPEFIRDITGFLRQPTLPDIADAETFMQRYAPDLLTNLFDAEVATEDEQAEVV